MDSHDITASPPAAPPPAVEPPLTAGQWLRQNLLVLVILVTLLAWLIGTYGLGGFYNIALAAVGLGFVIFIHELGHFAVAKWCDVHVEVFSIGFGPPLPGCIFKWGETTYMIALFPLGGYVKMVGENPENDEDDTDPRSFKNKKVWQRMAIISAGVIMNVILGAACFIFVFMTRGMEQAPGIIGRVDSGSPAWKKGAQSGMEIHQIGSVRHPYFNDLMPEVVLSVEGEHLPFVFGFPGPNEPRYDEKIEPRNDQEGGKPVIGVSPPPSLRLFPERASKMLDAPVYTQSAAAHAVPPFAFGDKIIGATDPATGAVTLLRLDPTFPQQPDYFDFAKRMQQLRGQPATVRVQRGDETVDIKVPPAYHYTFGLRMKMGRIVAVRDDGPAEGQLCPAKQAGVQYKNQMVNDRKVEGDLIKAVEVQDAAGKKLRWELTDPKDGAKQLDPMRLPSDLAAWAASTPGPRKVTLTVVRNEGHESAKEKVLELGWDDHFKYDEEVPINKFSSMAIPSLGIAYEVESGIEGVSPGSPATKARKIVNGEVKEEVFELKPGDVIKAIAFWLPARANGEPAKMMEKTKLFFWKEPDWQVLKVDAPEGKEQKPGQWAAPWYSFQHMVNQKQLSLRVERGSQIEEVLVVAEEAKDWPMTERGMRLEPDSRIQKADNLGQAAIMGFEKTGGYIKQIYRQLRSLVTGRISFVKNVGGPIQIFDVAMGAAESSIYVLIFFLGVISVNLAVVNFLPVPVLDGGHMVFLIYEGLRGKPASEKVREYATIGGLVLIIGLMLTVLYLDASRKFF